MKLFVLLIALSLMFFNVHCANKKVAEVDKTSLSDWHVKMHGFSDTLSKLVPLTASQKNFDAPKNLAAIKQEIEKLKGIAKSVDMTKHKPTNDPAMNMMAQRLVENVDEAEFQLQQGNRRYARQLIKGVTNHCIGCHTRTDDGRSNLKLSSLTDISGLSKLEQADVLISLRDYDKALDVYDKMINSPDAQIQHPAEIDLATKKALAIAVRVKRDPKIAEELVSRIIDARWAPVYLRLNALIWKTSIKGWEKENAGKAKSDSQAFTKARDLLRQGWSANASTPLGQAGLIYFLRASTILHELSGKSENQALYGEYLYNSGLVAEALRDSNLWTLQDAYYESCIRYSPRTSLSKKCYVRFEALTLSAYAADDESRLPKTVERRLLELRNLAETPHERFDGWFLLGE